MKLAMAFLFVLLFGCSAHEEEAEALRDAQPDEARFYVNQGSEDEEEDENQENNEVGLTFNGDPCTVDCSGHEAGYRWAEENGIDDPDDCGGNSQSFIEGCRSYTEEQ